MKKFNLKEPSTYAGAGIQAGVIAGVATQMGYPQAGLIFASIASILAAIAGFMPEGGAK